MRTSHEATKRIGKQISKGNGYKYKIISLKFITIIIFKLTLSHKPRM
jgi:hypothetical protein